VKTAAIVSALVVVCAGLVVAQRGQGAGGQAPNPNRAYLKVDGAVIAITHVRVIDGTGAPARADQTLILRDGNIAAMGPAASTSVPDGASVVDGTGKSVMPGLVMLHEHLYYPTGPGVYGQLGASFIRLYLAGGVTTMRTAGNTNGFMDFALARGTEAGTTVGPAIDATGPYLNGPQNQLQMYSLKDAADATKMVNYWADAGATSFKAYMQITKAELAASIAAAHARGLKVTGHLCSVTLAEAADLGIDNLEHGFAAATDFFPNKQPDVCPGQGPGQQSVVAADINGDAVKALIKKLIDKKVALTSTLTVFETFTPGRPMPPGLDVLLPELKTQFEASYQRVQNSQTSVYKQLFPKMMALELAFYKAGGMLVAGTDPTGSGGVIPGYSNQRQVELLVEEGLTPLEAIKVSTWNGAKYLGRDAKIGSIAVGKQADLMLVVGDPSTTISDVRNVDTVFRKGIAFDPVKLIASVKGKVGLW
jgi:imidazolonepropionase-like amidohydrolase